jgi:NAD(P)-dependent dehydrogenase (short-subunit alcohol dehydrogenase family)
MKPNPPVPGNSARSGGREATLAQRVVAITGAASGIGRAVAIECALRGATLALADLAETGLTNLEAELLALGVPAGRVSTRVVDVRDRQQLVAWALAVTRDSGPAAVLVNAAGVALHCPLDETTEEDFDWVMRTNFWGVVHGTQAFLPQFQQLDRGHVINVSSVFGLAASPSSGAYAASKFAVRGFTEALAIELSITHPRIHVTCVHPGGIKTPLVRQGRVRGRGPLARKPEAVSAAFDAHLARTSAATCAERIVGVMLRPRARLLIGADAHVIDWLVRLFPSFYQRLVGWLLRRSISRHDGTNE